MFYIITLLLLVDITIAHSYVLDILIEIADILTIAPALTLS